MPGIFLLVIITKGSQTIQIKFYLNIKRFLNTKSSKAQQDVQDTLKSHFQQLWTCIFDAVTASMLELLFSQDIKITLKCLLSSARYMTASADKHNRLCLPRVPLLEKYLT